MSIVYYYLCIFQEYTWIHAVYEDTISGSMADLHFAGLETCIIVVVLFEKNAQSINTKLGTGTGKESERVRDSDAEVLLASQ